MSTTANLERVLLVGEVEQFLVHEADLLGDRRFEDWLGLLTDDVVYRMPTRRNMPLRQWKDEQAPLHHFEDDHATLTARVKRLALADHGSG